MAERNASTTTSPGSWMPNPRTWTSRCWTASRSGGSAPACTRRTRGGRPTSSPSTLPIGATTSGGPSRSTPTDVPGKRGSGWRWSRPEATVDTHRPAPPTRPRVSSGGGGALLQGPRPAGDGRRRGVRMFVAHAEPRTSRVRFTRCAAPGTPVSTCARRCPGSGWSKDAWPDPGTRRSPRPPSPPSPRPSGGRAWSAAATPPAGAR